MALHWTLTTVWSPCSVMRRALSYSLLKMPTHLWVSWLFDKKREMTSYNELVGFETDSFIQESA